VSQYLSSLERAPDPGLIFGRLRGVLISAAGSCHPRLTVSILAGGIHERTFRERWRVGCPLAPALIRPRSPDTAGLVVSRVLGSIPREEKPSRQPAERRDVTPSRARTHDLVTAGVGRHRSRSAYDQEPIVRGKCEERWGSRFTSPRWGGAAPALADRGWSGRWRRYL
jgi:hypothetical protein